MTYSAAGDAQAAAQLAVVARRHEIEVLARDLDGQLQAGRFPVELAQLQHQALGQGSGADADRVEALDLRQRLFHLAIGDGRRLVEYFADFLDVGLEITVVIDRIDDGFADQHLARRKLLHLQLPQQMVLQRLAGLVGKFGDRAPFAVPATVLDAFGGPRLPDLVGLDGLHFRRGFGGRARNIREVFHLQHDVLFEGLLDLRVEIEHGQLQQPDRLL